MRTRASKSYVARAAAAGAALILAGAGTASAATLAGRVTGGAIPTGSKGAAAVRAVNVESSVITAAADLLRAGRWSLRVPAGPYSVLTSVVGAGSARQAITEIVRVKATGRAAVPVSLTRKRAPRPRRRANEIGLARGRGENTTPNVGAVAVLDLKGSGPDAHLGKGLSDMLVTDLVQGSEECEPTVIEWEDRALIQAELDLQKSKYFDPATRVEKRWIDPQMFVEGSLTTGPQGIGWSIRIRDAKTGAIVGGDDGSIPPGGDFFEAEQQIASRLLDQICGGRYDVTLSLRTDATFATHIASGTLNATITATGTPPRKGLPPRVFTGTGQLNYEALSFVSTTSCSYVGPVAEPGPWTVTLEITPAGRLKVRWLAGESGTPRVTATVVCENGSVSGQPGATLILPTPEEFELPVDGGQQAIAGGLNSGSDGWTHSGTMIVKRRPK